MTVGETGKVVRSADRRMNILGVALAAAMIARNVVIDTGLVYVFVKFLADRVIVPSVLRAKLKVTISPGEYDPIVSIFVSAGFDW